METKQMTLDDSYYSVCANALIKAQQKMTLREMQLIQIAIAQIVRSDTDLFSYTTTASELSKFLGVTRQSIYKDYAEITKRLLQNVITIDYNNTVKQFQWLSYAEFNKDTYSLTIRLHDDLKPFLIGLNKLYTQIDLNTILQFKSYYALRLYQLLLMEYGQSNKTKFEMSIDEMRNFFGIAEGTYSRPINLVNRTIKKSIDELNATDLCTIKNYELVHSASKGCPLVAVRFNVKW